MMSCGFFSVDSLRGIHALLVDSDPVGRTLSAAILRYCGAAVVAVESGEDVVRVLRLARPHVLIVTARSGDESLALIRRVRMLGPGVGGVVPAIAIGPAVYPVTAAGAPYSGDTACLGSPFGSWELCRAVADLTDARR
jgi:CheY-like chemotaxis protein